MSHSMHIHTDSLFSFTLAYQLASATSVDRNLHQRSLTFIDTRGWGQWGPIGADRMTPDFFMLDIASCHLTWPDILCFTQISCFIATPMHYSPPAFTWVSGTSHHLLSCIAHSCHLHAIRLAAWIWGSVLQHHLSSSLQPLPDDHPQVLITLLHNAHLTLPPHLTYLPRIWISALNMPYYFFTHCVLYFTLLFLFLHPYELRWHR
jgi:hypothetical protein